jgi:hypothetical protein
MTKPSLLLQECGTLNRVFAAFFMNQCAIKDGIDFEDSKPKMKQIACLNEDGQYFTEKDSPYGLKHFFHGRVEISSLDFDKFRVAGIYEFFDDELKEKITDSARYFSQAVKSHNHCDFVFSSLPDASPFLYDCILDPDTNFRSRLIIGRDVAENKYKGVWEFNCLLVSKFREVEPHPVYGIHHKDVDFMTDEEREKFNKKPISE